MSDSLVYSSSTDAGTTLIVEHLHDHALPANRREKAGLKTVAREAYEKRVAEERRNAFQEQRREALNKQRETTQERLDAIRAQIADISTKAAAPGVAKSVVRNAITAVEHLGKQEKKLVADVERLTAKIGA